MPVGQRWSKYTPLLLRQTITRTQYEWVMRYGLQSEKEAQETIDQITQVFCETTHPDVAAGKTQKERLKNLLSDGLWHSTTEITDKVYGISEDRGICRIASRIHDLRKEGLEIECVNEKGSLWKYRLVKH